MKLKGNEGKNSSENVCAHCIQRNPNKGKKTCKCVDAHCIQRTKEIKLVKIGALYTKKFKRK